MSTKIPDNVHHLGQPLSSLPKPAENNTRNNKNRHNHRLISSVVSTLLLRLVGNSGAIKMARKPASSNNSSLKYTQCCNNSGKITTTYKPLVTNTCPTWYKEKNRDHKAVKTGIMQNFCDTTLKFKKKLDPLDLISFGRVLTHWKPAEPPVVPKHPRRHWCSAPNKAPTTTK